MAETIGGTHENTLSHFSHSLRTKNQPAARMLVDHKDNLSGCLSCYQYNCLHAVPQAAQLWESWKTLQVNEEQE